MPSPGARNVLLVSLTVLAGCFGCCSGVVVQTISTPWPIQTVTHGVFPLPHHVPKYPGNVTLRFAMVHDVIHERFPQHGSDYYRERNRAAEAELAKLRPAAKGKVADEYFRLLDDWAVGLAFLGQFPQAVDKMRDKLKQQEALGYKGDELYSTYANLGTFLVLWQLTEGVQDVKKAKERLGESVALIRKAIELNPGSHFGRESWQLVLEEFLLAVLDNPQLLLRFDMVGNRLDRAIDLESAICFQSEQWLHVPSTKTEGIKSPESLAEKAKGYANADLADKEIAVGFRACIQSVGAEDGWSTAVTTKHNTPVPFDEPTLGIVGMWRMGAGANPHFALALGELMLRVGQRYMAWTAYERAYQLRQHLWPDATIQTRFGEHCRGRQRLIEQSDPKHDWAAARRQFDQELAFGQRYQKEYQDYESSRIKNGASVYDPQFYDEFEQSHSPIATPVGKEDQTFAKRIVTRRSARDWTEIVPGCILLAGVGAFGVALLWRLGGLAWSRFR